MKTATIKFDYADGGWVSQRWHLPHSIQALLRSTESLGHFMRACAYMDTPKSGRPKPDSADAKKGMLEPRFHPHHDRVPMAERMRGACTVQTASARHADIRCITVAVDNRVFEYHRSHKIDDILNAEDETVGQFFRDHGER